MEEIINNVAQSGLITFNLEDYYDKNERVVFDIKDCLFMGLILREKDFREFVKTHNQQPDPALAPAFSVFPAPAAQCIVAW